ncbi:hypothetical protein RF11_10716 [Thelohanellus kitauei]|uniref:Uncharacterized protein n=1 Tax=Thelohanellus kitauei TaxID=669202 RepID=A0A0C2MSK8_THEKT|nr:hypothetical protein RF11_10716 [Thelohanellus kitauei]
MSGMVSSSLVKIIVFSVISSIACQRARDCDRADVCSLRTLESLREAIEIINTNMHNISTIAKRISSDRYSIEYGLRHLVIYEMIRLSPTNNKWMENQIFSVRSLKRLCKQLRRMLEFGFKINDCYCFKIAKELHDCVVNRWVIV